MLSGPAGINMEQEIVIAIRIWYEKTEREKKHTEDGTVGSTGAGPGQQKKEENRYESLSGKNSGVH